MTTQNQLESIWHIYRQESYSALQSMQPENPAQAFYLSLLAYTHNDFEKAEKFMQKAHDLEPQNLVYRHALPCLQRVRQGNKPSVYSNHEAFAAYIRGGGNVPLYHSVSSTLQKLYQEYENLSLLDIGVGDGLALLPALSENIQELVLVEPSPAMLCKTLEKLKERRIPNQAYVEKLQHFVCHADGYWQIAQATFSLQSISVSERKAMLKWLAHHCRRLLLVEFDVPQFEDILHPDHVSSVLERMDKGLSEYGKERKLVAEGFIMPVMLSFFDRSSSRTNYEQPLDTWMEHIKTAGFRKVTSNILCDYWWSPAFLIDARTRD